MSGRIIERRDQVLIGRRSFLAAATCDLFLQMQIDKRTFFYRTWHYLYLYFFSRDDAQSCCPCACSCGSCNPWSAHPMASPDDGHLMYVLHHHRAGDRPGSWRHREPSAAHRASALRRLCRACAGCAQSLPTSPIVARQSTCTCAFHRNADATLRIHPRARPAALRRRHCAAICAPLPGFISTQCTTEPTGMFRNGRHCRLDRRRRCRT